MDIPADYSLFLSKQAIHSRLDIMAREISKKFEPSETLLVGILGGALFFMADLVRRLHPTFHLDFLALSSYHGTEKSSGTITLKKDLSTDCKGLNVLILDDILDTGQTLGNAVQHLKDRKATFVDCAVLLAKEQHRQNCPAGHVGFWVPDNSFYIGYGLDLGGRYRALSDIYRRLK